MEGALRGLFLVDWYPWTNQTFNLDVEGNKPTFLSLAIRPVSGVWYLPEYRESP